MGISDSLSIIDSEWCQEFKSMDRTVRDLELFQIVFIKADISGIFKTDGCACE